MTLIVFLIVYIYIYRIRKLFLMIILFIELIFIFILYAIRSRIDLVSSNPPLQQYFEDEVSCPISMIALAHFAITFYLWMQLTILPQLNSAQVKSSNWETYIFYLQITIAILTLCAFIQIFPLIFTTHYSTNTNIRGDHPNNLNKVDVKSRSSVVV